MADDQKRTFVLRLNKLRNDEHRNRCLSATNFQPFIRI